MFSPPMEWNENVTKPGKRGREREREKEDRRTNFEKLTKKRERKGVKNNEDRLKL